MKIIKLVMLFAAVTVGIGAGVMAQGLWQTYHMVALFIVIAFLISIVGIVIDFVRAIKAQMRWQKTCTLIKESK